MNDLVLRPTLGSRIHTTVERSSSIHVSALCVQEGGLQNRILQCWTDLPVRGRAVEAGWQAYDLRAIHEVGTVVLLAKQLPLDQFKLVEGKEYGLTWRTIDRGRRKEDNDSDTTHWLGHPSRNVIISFTSLRSSDRERSGCQIDVLQYDLRNGSFPGNRIPIDLHDCESGLVLERSKASWHTARQISSLTEVSDIYTSSLLLVRRTGRSHDDGAQVCVLYPYAAGHASVGIMRNGRDLYLVSSPSDKDSQREAISSYVIIVRGALLNAHKFIEVAVEEARRISTPIRETAERMERHHVSPLCNGETVGFCTWEALGNGRVRPMLGSVQQLLRAIPPHLPIDTLLVDDGWQHISEAEKDDGRRRLRSFDLQNDAAPQSSQGTPFLRAYVTKLYNEFPSLKHIGVWMTMAGHWDGLSEDEHWQTLYGPLEKFRLETRMWQDSRPREWLLPCMKKLDAFYNDYFRALKEAGITFVKIDDQADWEWIEPKDSLDVNQYVFRAWKALVRAGEANFGVGRIIHCMAIGQRFLNSEMVVGSMTRTRPLYVRTSDDTFPYVPDSHTWHVYHNTMQACLTRAIPALLSDADMITTNMKGDGENWSAYHLAFRCCFSSSKIWLSDTVEDLLHLEDGGHLRAVLAPMKDATRVDSLGELRTVQLTGMSTAIPLPSCIINVDLTGSADGASLKLGTRLEVTSHFTGILSVWNTRTRPASVIDMLTEGDVYEAMFKTGNDAGELLVRKSSFVICNSNKDQIAMVSSEELQHADNQFSRPLFAIHLPASGFEVFTISEMRRLNDAQSIACIGLLDKFVGACAVSSCEARGNAIFRAHINRAGRCGFVINLDDRGEFRTPKISIDCHIDEKTVPRSCLSQRSIARENLLLFVVDMIEHLRGQTDAGNASHSSLWSVDLCVQSIC